MDNINQQDSFNLIEFFAGIGGAGIALAPTFKTVLANDNSSLKAEVFRANHPETPFDERSIKEIRSADLALANLFWMSFPCTNFSALGDSMGFEGTTSAFVFDGMRILGEARLLGKLPPMVCCENVARFASHDDGRDFAALVQSFVSLGYRVGALVIDADRFLPVLRKRLFIVAVRRDVVIPATLVRKKPDPAWHPEPLVKGVSRLPLAARRAWLWLTMPEPVGPVPPVGALLDADDRQHTWFSEERVERTLAGCRTADVAEVERLRAHGPVLGIIAAQRADRDAVPALPIYTDGIARCLTAGNARQLVLRADERGVRIREFSNGELARLSGLPEGFVLPNAVTKAARCVGDGLCIPAVEWLGRYILAPLAMAARQPAIRPGTEERRVASPPTRNRRGAKPTGRTGIKAEMSSTSFYLHPEDLDRLHREAANDGVSMEEWIRRELDCSLAVRGQPPLRRYVSKRGSKLPESANGDAPSRDGDKNGGKPKKTAKGKKPFFGRGPNPHVEWFTPPDILRRILRALGMERFDIDAFSPGEERSPVPARRYITREENAHYARLHGVVYANPPYGPEIGACVERCARAAATGEAELVVGLIPGNFDTRWWSDHIWGVTEIFLLKGRVKFIDGSGQGKNLGSGGGSALVLWGADASTVAAFRKEFPDATHISRDQGREAA